LSLLVKKRIEERGKKNGAIIIIVFVASEVRRGRRGNAGSDAD